MDSSNHDVLALAARWLHILCAAALGGGAIGARFLSSGPVTAWPLGLVLAAAAGLLGSGFYQFFQRAPYPAGYHMAFGVKFLLALHVLAIAVLNTRPNVDAARRARWMTGTAISAALVMGLGAWLRSLG
ncbi:MAG: hypothetical protein FJW40_02475 [Acidobacteria bacterium]|nr:hypothetical protein [Acidobacteriota bacterium]